ncbi:MAG: type VI secretion system baseplate subunit TssK [Polyangiaceae bacterium]
MSERASPRASVVLELEGREDGVWLGSLREANPAWKTRAILVVRTPLPAADLDRIIATRVKCASYSQFGGLLSTSSNGVSLRRAPAPPGSSADEHWYSFGHNSTYWQDITTSATLAVYLPGVPITESKLTVVLDRSPMRLQSVVSSGAPSGVDASLAALRLEWRAFGGGRSLDEQAGQTRYVEFARRMLGVDASAALGDLAASLRDALARWRAQIALVPEPELLDPSILRFVAIHLGVDGLERVGLTPADLELARVALGVSTVGSTGLFADADPRREDEVRDAIVRYSGLSIETCELRMRPGALSTSGFLADAPLCEVISRDARALADVGVSHRDLGAFLELVVTVGAYETFRTRFFHEPRDARVTLAMLDTLGSFARRLHARSLEQGSELVATLPFRVEFSKTMGYQQHPLHVFDSSFLGIGASVFVIENLETGETLRGGDLTPKMIREGCFFGGDAKYRIDPEQAVRVLYRRG